MKRHVKEFHGDGSSREFVDQSPVEVKNQYVCGEPGCGKTFKHPSRLKKHEESVHLEFLELYCGEPGCQKPFTNAACLKAHIHTFHEHIKCEVCGTLQLKRNFKRHQRTHEGSASEKIMCSVEGCETSFSRKSNLVKHVKAVHQKIRPFRCRTSGCQRKFTYKHVRDKHEHTHQYVQGDFLEADERRLSRPRGGRKRQGVSVDALTRKRVVSLHQSSILETGADYLRWLLSDDEEQERP